MNTLMNSHNGRAEEAATLADTMGRQKHGCSLARRPSRSVSGNKREREREKRGKESENGWDGRECRPTNLHYLREEAQLFHADRFWRGKAGNDVGLDRQQNCRTDDIGTKRHDCLSSAAELCTRALAP